jgi:hypothetical protein
MSGMKKYGKSGGVIHEFVTSVLEELSGKLHVSADTN